MPTVQNITESKKASYYFNGSKQRRMASYCSKRLPALLRGITSKQHGDFYCLNFLQSFAAENKRESHKKLCENRDF